MAKAWPAEKDAEFKAMWGTKSIAAMAEHFRTSPGALYRKARNLGLGTKPSKFAGRPLRSTSRALTERRPVHTKFLATAETSKALFVAGRMSRKIGNRVTAPGAWHGMPIYTLTLAERITCPRSCAVWDVCYGNNMHLARRHVLDRDLMERMRWELTALNVRHPGGFVVRLHVLGDFGPETNIELALAYASAWRSWLFRFEALRVFGYTSWVPGSLVGVSVHGMNRTFPDRCRIRFSNHDLAGEGAVVIDAPTDAQPSQFVCPYETGKVDDCGACGLCWRAEKTVAFVKH